MSDVVKFELPTNNKPVRRQRREAAMAIAGALAGDPEGVRRAAPNNPSGRTTQFRFKNSGSAP